MSYGRKTASRVALFALATFFISGGLGLLVTIYSAEQVYESASRVTKQTVEPFPLGVDPRLATITEQVLVEDFYNNNLAAADRANNSWWNRLVSNMQTNQAFQQLASPVSRIVVIWPGERTEEAAKSIGGVLRWNAGDQEKFVTLMQTNSYEFKQGFILPGQYITHREATPTDIANLLQEEYRTEVTSRYTDDIETVIPLSDALIIASLIEREASDFSNMREISGVIWNRLFIDMPLQLDASLQYVKAENPYEPSWWPAVRPPDKFIDSPFNTYQNTGLPPAPIANPSVEAIVAALNPRVTDCLYYFHSRSREYYCSETYEEHVAKLKQVYGRGS